MTRWFGFLQNLFVSESLFMNAINSNSADKQKNICVPMSVPKSKFKIVGLMPVHKTPFW